MIEEPQDAPTGEHLERRRMQAQDHVRQLRQRLTQLGEDEIRLILSGVAKMATAPVTVIIAHHLEFWRELPFLFPHEDRRPHFEGKPRKRPSGTQPSREPI